MFGLQVGLNITDVTAPYPPKTHIQTAVLRYYGENLIFASSAI